MDLRQLCAGAADASVETIQEEYVYAIYQTRWLPAVQAREAAQGGAGRQQQTRIIAQRPELNAAAAARTPTDVPPPWLLPSDCGNSAFGGVQSSVA